MASQQSSSQPELPSIATGGAPSTSRESNVGGAAGGGSSSGSERERERERGPCRLTPKSSFSHMHSPQDSSSPGSSGSGGGNLHPQFQHRNSSTAMSASTSSTGVNVNPTTSTPVVVTPGTCPSSSASTPAGSTTNGATGISGPVMTCTPTSSKVSELKRKPSLHVVLPKFGSQAHHGGSSDSLNRSPHSPGSILGEDQQAIEDKELSYKVQRKNYRREKQRVAEELTLALNDPSIIILSGALKVRGKLKGWTKLLAVLKPGLLFLYKGKVKQGHWVATVLLHCCKVIERPSKKEGFCFKVFHPLDQSIWATKGPNGETIGAVVQPLPTAYLICRVGSAEDGKCWIDGLELALTCSSLLVRSPRTSEIMDSDKISQELEHEMGNHSPTTDWGNSDMEGEATGRIRTDSEKSDSDASHLDENPADNLSEEDVETPNELMEGAGTVADALLRSQGATDPVCIGQGMRQRRKKSEASGSSASGTNEKEIAPIESHYVSKHEADFFHSQGETSEVLGDENRSLLWFLVKQVRPGMDLSRVVLPTFILEPRSFLEKLSDYYYHADLLSRAVQENDAYLRMQSVLRWYLSGFYKKPKGLKKPYNPILGETYRCCWEHSNGSRTFYLAEQVSHHPPVSAFYVSNKKDGYVISSAILAKSKFYGNSTSAILDGQAILTMLPRGETYVITMPYAHCKGILVGTLSMELGGSISIICEKTGYFTELDFKLKGFLAGAASTNSVYGKIKLGRETIATIEGHWDSKIVLRNKRNGSEEVLWEVTDRVRSQRLKRFTVPLEEQLPTESEKKWQKVTEAIMAENQEAATEQKTVLEDEQRSAVAERAEAGSTWLPRHFVYDGTTWRYRHEDLRPWDDGNDLKEYENDYVIAVHRRHQTPIMRTSSLISVESKVKLNRNTSSTITVIPAPSKNQLNFNRTSQSNSCSNNHNNNNNNVCTPSTVVEINHKTAATTSTTGLITTNDSGSGMSESPCSSTSASGSNFETDQLLEMLSSLEQMLLSLNPEAGIAAIRDLIQQAEESQSVSQVDLGILGRELPGTDQVVPAFQSRESNRQLIDLLRQLLARQIQQSEQIEELRTTVASIQARLNTKPKPPKDPFPVTNTILAVIFAVAMQILMVTYWFGDGKLFPDITRHRN